MLHEADGLLLVVAVGLAEALEGRRAEHVLEVGRVREAVADSLEVPPGVKWKKKKSASAAGSEGSSLMGDVLVEGPEVVVRGLLLLSVVLGGVGHDRSFALV